MLCRRLEGKDKRAVTWCVSRLVHNSSDWFSKTSQVLDRDQKQWKINICTTRCCKRLSLPQSSGRRFGASIAWWRAEVGASQLGAHLVTLRPAVNNLSTTTTIRHTVLSEPEPLHIHVSSPHCCAYRSKQITTLNREQHLESYNNVRYWSSPPWRTK